MTKFYKIDIERLKFDESFPTMDYDKWNLPILIDKDYNVLLGHMFRKNLKSPVLVIVMNDYIEQIKSFAPNLEEALCQENDPCRIELIKRDIKNYFYKCKEIELDRDIPSLITDYRDERVITPENYRQPPEYNFKKHSNRTKNEPDWILDPEDYETDLLKEFAEYESMSCDLREQLVYP